MAGAHTVKHKQSHMCTSGALGEARPRVPAMRMAACKAAWSTATEGAAVGVGVGLGCCTGLGGWGWGLLGFLVRLLVVDFDVHFVLCVFCCTILCVFLCTISMCILVYKFVCIFMYNFDVYFCVQFRCVLLCTISMCTFVYNFGVQYGVQFCVYFCVQFCVYFCVWCTMWCILICYGTLKWMLVAMQVPCNAARVISTAHRRSKHAAPVRTA